MELMEQPSVPVVCAMRCAMDADGCGRTECVCGYSSVATSFRKFNFSILQNENETI